MNLRLQYHARDGGDVECCSRGAIAALMASSSKEESRGS